MLTDSLRVLAQAGSQIAALCALWFLGGILLGYWRGWADRKARDSAALKFAYECWKIYREENVKQ